MLSTAFGSFWELKATTTLSLRIGDSIGAEEDHVLLSIVRSVDFGKLVYGCVTFKLLRSSPSSNKAYVLTFVKQESVYACIYDS